MTENSGGNKLVQVFFSPAVFLMNRLDVTRKFVLLGLMSLIAIAVVIYSLSASLGQVISSSQRELQGLELIKPFPKAMQILQRHRGLSAGLLGGDETMRDSRASTEREAVAAFKAMEEKLSPGLASGEGFRHIRADWERLRKDGLKWTIAENYAAHTRLIGRIQSFEGMIADEYALILDPELDTYYLIDAIINNLPHAIEHLGQLRAYGAGILASKRITAQQKIETNILIGGLDHVLGTLNTNLDKTGRYNPALQGLISAISADISSSAQQISGLVTADILIGRFATSPNDFLGISTAAIDRGYVQLNEALLPAAEALLKARIARAENTLRFSVGIAVLLFMVVAYFSVGIGRVIAVNIRSLARAAHAFASGNLQERVGLGARDELGQVGDSFNEMADGFSALLKASRENEERLRDLSMHLEERVKERTVELEHARQEAEMFLRRNQALMLTSMDGIHVMDMQGNLLAANDAFCRMLGYTQKEAAGLNVAEWDAQRPAEELRAHFRGIIGKSTMCETLWRRKDGTLLNVEVSVAGVEMDGQGFVFASSRDITARKVAEEEISRLAFYDTLTGLPNRRLFIDRFQAALAVSARHNNYGAILFIDLDRFKMLNDAFGHDCGDLLLIEVAARIRSCVREMDTVARLGGDEFVVLIEEIGNDQDEVSRKAGLVAGKIRETLAHPYRIKEYEHHCSPSIGISLYHGNEDAMDTLLQHADMAMYQAKKSGRNTVRFFDADMQHNVEVHAGLVDDLRHAIERRQLRLYYQIQVDDQNRPLGAEALLRWIHPQRGMVMPEQFIPLAEESDLIIEIDDWVLETACRQLALWDENAQTRDLLLTINVSAKQFAMPDFADKVAGMLRAHRVNPARLKLELTEGMVLDNLAGAAEKMHSLKALGVSLSMDDFGARYSSLSYLKQLPVDQVKIDKGFVQAITKDSGDALLVQNIIDLVNNLHLSVIAEGVETEAQLASLKQHDCITYQGFLFGKAVPIEEFEELLISG